MDRITSWDLPRSTLGRCTEARSRGKTSGCQEVQDITRYVLPLLMQSMLWPERGILTS
jgi:hypothetical protein